MHIILCGVHKFLCKRASGCRSFTENTEWIGFGKGKMFIAERDGYTMPSVHHSAALS